jgi:hypothetical protein
MPLAAYSKAKALLTAGMADLESTARIAGALPLGWSDPFPLLLAIDDELLPALIEAGKEERKRNPYEER